jgi:Spy/CpxP family protein refolding chaperone
MENIIITTAPVNRMTRLKSFALPTVMACILTMPVLAQSTDQAAPQPQDSGKRTFGKFDGHHGRGGDVWQRLNLTEAQKTQMKEIRERYHERTQSLRQELRAKRQDLRQANQGDTFNEALAIQVLTESAALEAKLMGERFKMRQEMRALLTPEQNNQLEQMRERHIMKDTERQSFESQ